MDTTFPENAAMYRAITNPLLWHLGYWVIIGGEGLTFLLLLIGGVALVRARHAEAAIFDDAKKWTVAGATIGFWSGFSASWLWAASGS